jgi:hypothetical protein
VIFDFGFISDSQSEIKFRHYCSSKKIYIFAREFAGVAQLVEHDLAKVGVAGSSPVSRSDKKAAKAAFFN